MQRWPATSIACLLRKQLVSLLLTLFPAVLVGHASAVPADQFTRFLTETNKDLDVVFSIRERTLSGFAARTHSFAAWNGVASETIHAISQANAFLFVEQTNRAFGRLGNTNWAIIPGGHQGQVAVEYSHGAPEQHVGRVALRAGPETTQALVKRTTWRYISQLGVVDARPGSISLNGNLFRAAEEYDGSPMTGSLDVTNGLPSHLTVVQKRGRTTLLTSISYYYRHALEIPGLPDSMVIERRLNGAPLSETAIQIHKLARAAISYDPSVFSAARYIRQSRSNVMAITYSNDVPYQSVGDHGVRKRLFIGPNPLAVEMDHSRAPMRGAVLCMFLILLFVPFGIWWWLRKRPQPQASKANQ